MKRTIALLSILFFVVALAGCGGGDDAAPPSTAPATTEESSTEDTAADGDASGVCAAEESLIALDDALGGALPDFEGATTAIEELLAADDGALEEQLNTLGDGVDRVASSLDGVDLNDEDAVNEALAGIDLQDREDISTAADEIKAYVFDTCGLTLGDGPDDTTP